MIPTHMPGESDYDFLQRAVRTETNVVLLNDTISHRLWTFRRDTRWVGEDEWLHMLSDDEFILFWLFVLEAEHQAEAEHQEPQWPTLGGKPINPEFLGAQPPRAGEDY